MAIDILRADFPKMSATEFYLLSGLTVEQCAMIAGVNAKTFQRWHLKHKTPLLAQYWLYSVAKTNNLV